MEKQLSCNLRTAATQNASDISFTRLCKQAGFFMHKKTGN